MLPGVVVCPPDSEHRSMPFLRIKAPVVQYGSLFIDHVFVLIDQSEVETAVRNLANFGLDESSRRSHEGLGTSNVFFCFDNFFLEILWIADRKEASGTRLGSQLIERLEGRESGMAPFGIGFRTENPDDVLPFAVRIFEPPKAMNFNPIPIARSSDDARQPLLFRARRALRPDAWTDGQAGERQRRRSLAEVIALRYSPPRHAPDCLDLRRLQDLGMIELADATDRTQIGLTLSNTMREAAMVLPLTSPLRFGQAR